jgi:hypothetical protein
LVHKLAKLSALAAVAGLLAACSGVSQPSIPASQYSTQAQPRQTNTVVDGMNVLHILPAKGASQTGGATTSSGNLLYGGGPVQNSPSIVLIFWGNWSTSDPEYTRLTAFFNGVGGSNWNSTVTQYYDGAGPIANSLSERVVIDKSSVPSKPSSSQVGAEAQKFAVSNFGGTNTNYFVALPTGHDPSGFKTRWCAWHSSESESEGTVSYTNFPYQSDGGTSCGADSVNSGGTYDGVTIVSGHEEAETMTDPQPSTGWTDSSGSEIGDKCAWTNLQNTSFSTGTFPTQPLWSNSAGGCVQ